MQWYAIGIGQFLAVLNTLTGVFSNYLLIQGLETPIFQLLFNYGILIIIYGAVILIRKDKKPTYSMWWKYALAAITDTQGNFLVILAYEWTSVVSVFTLMNTSVIIVMVFSYIFLKRRYNKIEYLGTGIALCGVVLVIISDLQSVDYEFGGTVEGDMIVIAGTVLYCL